MTLARFDIVYYSHFKTDRNIKRHYFGTHTRLNPSRIVPLGPDIDLNAPHGRDSLGS